MNRLFILIFLLFESGFLFAHNPIIPNKGINDPHIHIIDGKAYLSASHDRSIGTRKFTMDNWMLWSSEDLVNWKPEYTLTPEETYIGRPFNRCWATDFVKRNGKFYWYFSEGNQQTGVMVADSPSGPWKDPLGKPLLGSDLTPTDEYDLGIVKDESGDYYIVFGVWNYYIAKLNEDMISLAEAPRKIELNNPHGPYNLDGKNKNKPTDDKPFIHFYNGNYYLSWGIFYGMSKNVYGPYDYKGLIMKKESFAPGYDKPTWPNGFTQGRHGSFFQWHNQWYFAYCDISQTGNRYFRDTFISYIHYKKNGEMALIRVDGTGVGEYDANKGLIEAVDYFKAKGIVQKQAPSGNFFVDEISDNDFLLFPNIKGLGCKKRIVFSVFTKEKSTIEIRQNSSIGKLFLKCEIVPDGNSEQKIVCDLPKITDTESLCFVFRGKGRELLQFYSFSFE